MSLISTLFIKDYMAKNKFYFGPIEFICDKQFGDSQHYFEFNYQRDNEINYKYLDYRTSIVVSISEFRDFKLEILK